MNKTNIKSKRNTRGALKECDVNKLVVKPLARKIRQHTSKCLKQGLILLKKIEEVDESVAIIAREIKRQADKAVGRVRKGR